MAPFTRSLCSAVNVGVWGATVGEGGGRGVVVGVACGEGC